MVKQPFETVLQSISRRIVMKTGQKKKKVKKEQNVFLLSSDLGYILKEN